MLVSLVRWKEGVDEHLPDEDPTTHRRFRGSPTGPQYAVDIATSTGSELHLVTVMGSRAYHLEMQEIVDQLGQRGKHMLDEQVKKVEEMGGKVSQAHAM
jgi:hypothetical protein